MGPAGGFLPGLWLREGADADGWIEAALEERDFRVETKGTVLVGHGDTVVGGVSGPPTLGGRMPPSSVSV